MAEDIAERVWHGKSSTARVARAILSPFGALFGAVVTVRNAAYDLGWFPSFDLELPTLSVGNLTAGGTGKTPISSWCAAQMLDRHLRPAIVLRGYGDDEPQVHEQLCPGAVVVADADRVRGVRVARAAGAMVAILDDGFQHRRARRQLDIVLLAAEAHLNERFLPAGPRRESFASLARASLVIVTRKSASSEAADLVRASAARQTTAPVVIAHLAPSELVDTTAGTKRSLASIRGERVTAIAGIANPHAFAAQLRDAGAIVATEFRRDHHAFSEREALALHALVGAAGLAVCTLKDAVKLARYWPRQDPSLWYVSQRVTIEQGASHVQRILDRFASEARRHNNAFTPAVAGPTADLHVP